MQCHSIASIDGEQAVELPAMMATLGSYDRLFGPRHIQTLSLAAHIAEVLRALGQSQTARCLLERVVRDLNHSGNRTHATRISALHAVKDLLLEQAEIARAIAVQLAGPGAPETIAARADLGEMLMLSSESTIAV